ncbi:MAG: hypothetical protein CMM87_06905 [Rickettsiales bacterium]|nr:hypothetical protein [Rickettsiales bacterium]|tara:strand:+ start:5162 stop:5824 length:663 start_codon:yes stop_codon:yes gene_type:complete
MFNPYDTQAVIDFLSTHAADVKSSGSSATGVRKLMHTVDARVQRHRDAKQLLKQTAANLVDAGWTRHDVVASRAKWSKLVRQHGAHDLVQTLQLTLHDATELGMTATQLLRMSSDLLQAWNVRAQDMIALGVTVPQLLDRYETGQNLADMGFTSNIMQQMGMPQAKAEDLFAGVAQQQACSTDANCIALADNVQANTAADMSAVNERKPVQIDGNVVLDF